MSSNAQSAVMEPEPVVVYNDPLLLCAEENIRSECAFVFKTINSDIIPNSTIIFEPNFYQMGSELSEHFPTGSAFNPSEELPYHIENEANNSGSKLQMMQIFYRNVPKDQPEFIDVNNLTSFEPVETKTLSKDSTIVSDDENDVIFVKEYKNEEIEQNIPAVSEAKDESKEDGIRRNPVRKARTRKGRRHLQKEHLLEEDFAFLDQFDEDNLLFCKSKSSSSTNSAESCLKESYKEWPLNVFERPEYNPQTNKIEPFDYTIREIQNKQLRKKARLETCTKAKKKPKKKYIIKKRKPKSKKVVDKVAVKDLNNIVTTTFDMVSSFLKISTNNTENPHFNDSKDGLYNLLKNQTTLMAVVHSYDKKEVSECVSKLLSKS